MTWIVLIIILIVFILLSVALRKGAGKRSSRLGDSSIDAGTDSEGAVVGGHDFGISGDAHPVNSVHQSSGHGGDGHGGETWGGGDSGGGDSGGGDGGSGDSGGGD